MRAALISLQSTSSQWTAAAMKKYFDEFDDLNIKNIEVHAVDNQLQIFYGGKPLKLYDCIYVKGSFRYEPVLRSITAALYDKAYMPLTPESFTLGHDKLLTHLALQRNSIPMPKTYIVATAEEGRKLLERIHYPIVMKFPSGTQGKGVMFADSFASASSLLDAMATLKQPLLIQEYIETGGRDIRALVIGDKVVAAMERIAVEGEKRANIHAGATGEAKILDAYTQKIAIQTVRAIGADICAVDMLAGPKGPLVIEVNLSPGLQGITQATNVDVADKIAQFLHRKTKEWIESQKDSSTKKIIEEVETKKIIKREMITSLSLKGNRIILPEVITNLSGFQEHDDVEIKTEKGQVTIKKFDVK